MARRRDRTRRVEQDRVAPAAVLGPLEDRADRRRVFFWVPTAECVRLAARDPELERVDRPLPNATVDYLADEVRAAGESSSMPPAPWTTNARRAPSRASTSAIVSTSSGE